MPKYRVEAMNGTIVAFPRSGRVTIHLDCWGERGVRSPADKLF